MPGGDRRNLVVFMTKWIEKASLEGVKLA